MSLVSGANPVKIETQPLQFKGLNKKEVIADNEISSGQNIGFEALPKISPRFPREKIGSTWPNPKDLFSAGGKLVHVDGTDFYYDGIRKGTVTATKKSMVDFNGHIVIFPDKKYYCYKIGNPDVGTFGSFETAVVDGGIIGIGNGVQTDFRYNSGQVLNNVYLDEVETTDYTEEDGVITFGSTPIDGGNIGTGNGINTKFTYSYTDVLDAVYLDGVETTAYTDLNGAINFDTAPGEYVAVTVDYLESDVGSEIVVTVDYTSTTPDLDYVTTHYNRVFGCKGNTIRGSKWGDFKVWEDFSGEQDDSWATDVASEGDFTGIYTYQDHVIFFKSNYMAELYGAYPSQFELIDVGAFGLIDQRAVAEGSGYLFFVDKDGVKQYTGGIPKLMSDELNETYVKSALISDGTKFYLFNYNGTSNKIYVFDLRTMTWMPEDNLDIVAFTEIEKDVYAFDTSGDIWKFNSGSSSGIVWNFETKEFDMNTFYRKVVRKLKVSIKMDAGANISLRISKNGGTFKVLSSYTNGSFSNYKEIYQLIDLDRVNRFKIKISGLGKSIVTGVFEYSFRSDKK